MSNSNREARLALARIFGNTCMFRKAHVEDFVDNLGTIKTYKTFKEEKHYASKKAKCLEQMLTYHHLKHKSEGGRATIENGAIINELAHRYLHLLPRNQEEIINDYLREWKREHYDRCNIELVEELEDPFEVETAEMSVESEGIKFKKLSKKERKQKQRKERKAEKKRLQKMRREWEDR